MYFTMLKSNLDSYSVFSLITLSTISLVYNKLLFYFIKCDTTYRYIGGIEYSPHYIGFHEVTLRHDQYIGIQAGDTFGHATEGNGIIPFDNSDESAKIR